MPKYRNVIIKALIILTAFLLQSMLFGHTQVVPVRPNLLLIVTSLSGFMNGKKEGIKVGFACGFLWDVFYGDLLGFYALILLVIGYVNGRFRSMFFNVDVRLPLLLTAASDLGFSLIVCITQFFLRGQFSFGNYLIRIMLPELVYTVVILIIVYPLFNRLNIRMHEWEQRSSGKFV
ncbi:MAG: rod shape-determining protein MreD [Lachnospiraceae bacterium]|nr:rod shape-determining protein MreD [Lachnospiraceae bacterium]